MILERIPLNTYCSVKLKESTVTVWFSINTVAHFFCLFGFFLYSCAIGCSFLYSQHNKIMSMSNTGVIWTVATIYTIHFLFFTNLIIPKHHLVRKLNVYVSKSHLKRISLKPASQYFNSYVFFSLMFFIIYQQNYPVSPVWIIKDPPDKVN